MPNKSSEPKEIAEEIRKLRNEFGVGIEALRSKRNAAIARVLERLDAKKADALRKKLDLG